MYKYIELFNGYKLKQQTPYSKEKYYKDNTLIDKSEIPHNVINFFEYANDPEEYKANRTYTKLILNFLEKDLELLSFQNSSVKYVVLPENLEVITKKMFQDCNSLVYVNLDNVIKIEEEAFKYCYHLQEIILPNSITILPCGVFEHCRQLQTVKLSNNLEIIETDAFSNCHVLEYIEIPDSVKKIKPYAFRNCVNLETIKLSSSLEEIENEVFSFCSKLKNIQLHENIKKIGQFAFYKCGFTHIDLPNSLLEIDESAFQYTHLEEITIPANIKIIKKGTFYGCENLVDVRLNTNLEYIQEDAFSDCINLQTITIPSSVNIIHIDAFNNTNLKEIIFEDDSYKDKPGLQNFIEQYKSIIKIKSLDDIIKEQDKEENDTIFLKETIIDI